MVCSVEFLPKCEMYIFSQYSHSFKQHNCQKKLIIFFPPHLDFEFNMVTFF